MSFYTHGAGKNKDNKTFVIIHVVKHDCIFIVQ